MNLIDTHAHLEDLTDLDAAISRAKQAGVIAVIAVGSDLASNQQILRIADKYKGYVYPALGLHPGNLGDPAHIEATFQQIESNIEQVVAIGEVGLDYHYREARKEGEAREVQRQVYRRALSIARANNKPALIHSRGAWQDCLALTQELNVQKAVFHWFSGPMEVLNQIIAGGYFISATPAAEYSQAHRQALVQTPIDRLLLETDSPVVYRGQAAEPAHVMRSLGAVSALKNLAVGLVSETTTTNAKSLFQLNID